MNKVLNELPDNLKALIRCVLTSFYTVECSVTMELLIHHPGIKEDDLLELLKFDKKQLRATVTVLKQDQFISSRIQMETDNEGKATRHNYYYINYSTFVNVVKYKLENMRRKIEVLEKSSVVRPSFKCPKCEKTFSDLDAGQLYDPFQEKFLCTFCASEVEEEAIPTSVHLSRLLMTTFNEQMEPLYALLKELDGIQLSASVLEPALLPSKNRSGSSSSKHPTDDNFKWSGEATKNKTFGYTENEITISMDTNDSSTTSSPPPKVNNLPVWMRESTVAGISQEMEKNVLSLKFDKNKSSKDSSDSNDIMQTLLSHEKTSTSYSNNQPAAESKNSSSNFSLSVQEDSSHSHHRSDEEGVTSEEDDEVTVMVGGVIIPYADVTSDVIAKMTDLERAEYTRIGRELHELYS